MDFWWFYHLPDSYVTGEITVKKLQDAKMCLIDGDDFTVANLALNAGKVIFVAKNQFCCPQRFLETLN